MQAPANQSVTFDVALDALGDVHRRRLLVDLVRDRRDYGVTAALAEGPPESGPRRREFMELVHVHLPKLEQYGIIEWNREADEVTRGPEFGRIRPLVELLHDRRAELPDGWV